MKTAIKKGAVRVAVAGLVVTGASVAVSPAANAAGGCTNYGFNGTTIGVCINDRNTSTPTTAYSDFYVNGRFPSNCYINLELWDTTGTKYAELDNLPCNVGHSVVMQFSGWWHWYSGYCDYVHSFTRIFVNGVQANPNSFNSPDIRVCDN